MFGENTAAVALQDPAPRKGRQPGVAAQGIHQRDENTAGLSHAGGGVLRADTRDAAATPVPAAAPSYEYLCGLLLISAMKSSTICS